MYELSILMKRKKELDEAYYNRGEQLVSDEEYDVLKRRIILLGGKVEVGAAPWSNAAFSKFERKEPMLSLGNVFTRDEFERWRNGLYEKLGIVPKLVAEPKLDGLSLELRYSDGLLTSASTRGNGLVGEDVTANALAIAGVPQFISSMCGWMPDIKNGFAERKELIVRGEVVVMKRDFREYNELAAARGEKTFVSPRSMAVGSLKQKDPNITASRNLTFVAYQANYGENVWETSNALNQFGFTVPVRLASIPKEENMYHRDSDPSAMYEEFVKMRDGLPYDADGVVFKVYEYALREKLGETSTVPNWAIAWKFEAQRAITTLRDVEWRVGRTGKVVPRATFDPVFVAGATLTHASLHSIDVVTKLERQAGFSIHAGCKITVERSGDVIPYVSSLVTSNDGKEGIAPKQFVYPVNCPQCGEELKKLDSGELRCENSECNFWEKIFHFMRTVFGMKGIGESIIPALENAEVETFADLFGVKKHHIIEIDGLGEAAWRIYHENVEAVRSEGIPFADFLRALGIRGLGHRMSVSIAKEFKTVDNLLRANAEDIAQRVDGIGMNTAMRVFKALYKPYRELERIGIKVNSIEQMEESLPLSGKTVCFTGTLSMPRKKFEELVTQLGGTPVSSVSGKLDVLVLGENPGSKLQKAEKLGITIKDEAWVKGLKADS